MYVFGVDYFKAKKMCILLGISFLYARKYGNI